MWKLAGIHTMFNAALLDRGGLDLEGRNVPDTPADKPSAFYSTRLAAHRDWIRRVIDFRPGDDLQLTGITVAGNDVQVGFQSFTNRLYRLERCDDLVAGTWVPWTNSMPGTNGPLTVTDTDAVLSPRRFYRLGLDR